MSKEDAKQSQTLPDSHVESKPKDFLVVGIGASAGGIKALKGFFNAMPSDSGMAFVVILHLSPEHESQLPSVLQMNTEMPVIQVQQTLKVEPNRVYVIPPAKHLAMAEGEIQLMEPEQHLGQRVPVDLLLRTLAVAYGQNGIGIILSGNGTDGTMGLKRIKEAGGICIVQDPNEAEYDSMPLSAIATNLVDLVLPVGEMPAKIIGFKQSAEKVILPVDDEELSPGLGADALPEVLALVKARTKHDFSNYKLPTMLRRVARRMQVHQLADIPEYVSFLKANPDEVEALLRDLLISVTNFFRDREAFAALERDVVPKLFVGKTGKDQVRVWCVGCATGEEAFSIGMLLSEYAATLVDPPKTQIFASDIAEDSIADARECRYDQTIEADVSPERLRLFFTKDGSGYRVKKELREIVLFSPHNILRDPPFSRQDLVTCRNLLIYLNRKTQEKVMEIFHFALRLNGFLFLGASELAETVPTLFALIDEKQRIYQSRPAASTHQGVPLILLPKGKGVISELDSPNREPPFSFNDLHLKLIERFSPPSILVDENYDILHLSETAGRYLRFTGGEPTRNLAKVAHPALRPDLLAALFAAKQESGVKESRYLRLTLDGVVRFVNLTVHPIETPEVAPGYFLIIFDEIAEESIPAEILQKFVSVDEGAELVIRRLEETLQHTRDRLGLTMEQHEVSVEELKASNEELQAINEELHATAEELETSKEELQSVNEELTTVNAELTEKVAEVEQVNLDLQNVMVSTDVSTILIDRDLQIKRFSLPVRELFNIIATDVGRPLEHLTHRLDYKNLLADAKDVLRNLEPLEREVQSVDGRWHAVRLIPYRTDNDEVDGVLLSFVDITLRKTAELALRNADRSKDEFLATLAHELRNPLAPIRSGLEVMRRAGSDQALTEKTLRIVERQADMVVRLVDDLLDIARITQDKIKLKIARIELKTAIDMALEGSQSLTDAATHTLVVSLPDEPVYLDADVTRVAQVLLNILTNAVKYTARGGNIWLTMEKHTDEAVIRIRDSGVGIPADMLWKIFDMYRQIDSADERTGAGLGIGLTIVKKLVELHGGSVAAFSDGEGKGSEFVVRLPVAKKQLATVESKPPLAQGNAQTVVLEGSNESLSNTPARFRILVIDDNYDAAEMLSILLTMEGHTVRTAHDGESAIEIAAEFHPAACVVDIGLPNMNGYDVARSFRETMSSVLLIALSGWGRDEDRRLSREAGFDYHFVKPTEIKEITLILAQIEQPT